ncbi:Fe(3+)-hydroxamate ABC transporter permease FhuB [Auraticoccus sp. F435]|uniref:Fe(3+)-hydroxamate ABC transporter permease FhuB n=1 Tax=Auraticoccus cholistanensis TaxID=2656650 RepID=A0A6A9UT80_9ACTN|nr:iron ABC transporter permease [Auraticoccus cholistanensis]MVA74882.1 Fe(3+)-hydroxamate ABC transporter permease FhuB [Auraticoccus cholistanensis]
MTTTSPAPAAAPAEETPGAVRRRRGSVAMTALVVGLVGWLVVVAVVHVTQGSADVGAADLLALVTGRGTDETTAVVVASRLPRLVAGLAVGLALGVAGAVLQSVARNPLASPDTLAVNAGAYLALTVVAAAGVTLPLLSSAAVAFLGGLLTAALVLGLASGAGSSAIRLVLAGSVVTLGFHAIASVLLLLFPWQTQGLFAWGAGSLGQAGLDGVLRLLPALVLALALALLLGRWLDLLQLGDDAASALGLNVRLAQTVMVVLAVLLSAVAVTAAGPIGFVGLAAPVLVRLLVRWVRPLRRHRVLLAVSGLAGVALVLTADVLLRALFGSLEGVSVPTGVVTSVIGAVFMVALAQTVRTGIDADSLVTMRAGTRLGLRHPRLLLGGCAVLLLAAVLGSALLGDALLLAGDVLNWLRGISSVRVDIILDSRMPRVVAAVLAGACLALAGSVVQGVTRNPLADPGILGVSGGAGAAAVLMLVVLPNPGFWSLLVGALLGALLAGALVFGFSARDGVDQARMVLVGIGVSAGTSALITLMLVRTDPWNQSKALTWLGGSTYGVGFWQSVPMLVALVLAAVALAGSRRDLDLLQLDETTPRVLGVATGRARLLVLLAAVVLTAAATASIGVIAFVGLVAPHAARLLIGRRHGRLLPLSALLGGLLVLVSDTAGRTVIAPDQLPAGLTASLVGCPYFLWLLWRMRVKT